jgi:hypothetical protein
MPEIIGRTNNGDSICKEESFLKVEFTPQSRFAGLSK